MKLEVRLLKRRILKHLPLRQQQNQRQQCAEDIGDSAGAEHSLETVETQPHVYYRHQIHHRDEEDDLARETGDNGDPRLVDALEEVGVDDGEGDEWRHHGDVRQRHLRDVEQERVAGKRHRDDARHGATDDGSDKS